jgi:hypothetical protein
VTILSYICIGSFIMFFGGLFFGGKPGEKPYAFLFTMMIIMAFSGLLLSLGTVGLLPELVW